MHNLKMEKREMDFLEDQKTRIGYCTKAVDKKWQKTMDRRKKDQKQQEAAMKRRKSEIKQYVEIVSLISYSEAEEEFVTETSRDDEYCLDGGDAEEVPPTRRNPKS